jgi:hypothetical protein
MVRVAAYVRDRTQMAPQRNNATCRLLSPMARTLATTGDSLQPATVLDNDSQMRPELGQDRGNARGLGRIKA